MLSAFTHETTHINDRIAYFGGFGRREGTDVEAMPKECCNHQRLRVTKVNTVPWDLTWPLKEKTTVISGTTLIQTS